jgi:O-antigen biosynthesis protein
VTGNWTAIVVNYNGEGFIESCLQALEASTLRPAEIIVVDNASSDESLLEVHAHPRVQVLAQRTNLGFAGGANAGLDVVETDYAVIMNPDVEVDPSFGTHLVRAFDSDSRLGAAGALLLYPDGTTIQHAGGVIEKPLLTTRHHMYGVTLADADLVARDVDFVTGGAMGLRMSAIHSAGGFNTALSPVYYEDVELCVRLRHDHWRVRFIPDMRALHHEGVTLQREPAYYHYLHRNRITFALGYLTPEEWSTGFVPAEIARIRSELQHLDHPEWMTVSGADAIEELLRSPSGWGAGAMLSTEPFDDLRTAIDETRAGWEVTGKPSSSRVPFAGLLSKLVNGLGPRQYVDAALADQRAFNAAVVRALEAQDRLHREQLASTLLLAVDLLARLHHLSRIDRSSPDGSRTET